MSLLTKIYCFIKRRKPTLASVTSRKCRCGVIQECVAKNVGLIAFDDVTKGYKLLLPAVGFSNARYLYLYHCPFCGGVLFSDSHPQNPGVLQNAERERLRDLLGGLTSIEDFILKLGPPEWDSGNLIKDEGTPKAANNAFCKRSILYTQLSQHVNVCITEQSSGHIEVGLLPKNQ